MFQTNGYFITRMRLSGESTIRAILGEKGEFSQNSIYDMTHIIFTKYYNYTMDGIPQELAYDMAFDEWKGEQNNELNIEL